MMCHSTLMNLPILSNLIFEVRNILKLKNDLKLYFEKNKYRSYELIKYCKAQFTFFDEKNNQINQK